MDMAVMEMLIIWMVQVGKEQSTGQQIWKVEEQTGEVLIEQAVHREVAVGLQVEGRINKSKVSGMPWKPALL